MPRNKKSLKSRGWHSWGVWTKPINKHEKQHHQEEKNHDDQEKSKKNSDAIMVECLDKLPTMLETTFNKNNKTRMV
jgi:hypothetical protein